MIQQGWREQYARMRRSREALREVGTTATAVGSDVARDRLFHFFQDAYHLKDWIKNDPSVQGVAVERAITAELAVCADLANGTKHFGLDSARRPGPRTGDPLTAFVSQSVTVAAPTATSTAGAAGGVVTIGPAGSRQASGSSATVDAASVYGPSGHTVHAWEVESGGQVWDAQVLADEVVQAWETWLTTERLLP